METIRVKVAVVAAFCVGIVVALSFTVFTSTARAGRDHDYRIVKSAHEVVNMGEQGWEYIGLAPGGQWGIMKK